SLFRNDEEVDTIIISQKTGSRLARFQSNQQGDYTVCVELMSAGEKCISSVSINLEIREDLHEVLGAHRNKQLQSLKGGHLFYDNVNEYFIVVKFLEGGLDKLRKENDSQISVISGIRDIANWVKVFDKKITQKSGMEDLSNLYRLDANIEKRDMLHLAEELESLPYVIYCSITPDTHDMQPPKFPRNPHSAPEVDNTYNKADITPDFNALQTYLDEGAGMNVRKAWKQGATGEGVSIRHLDYGVYRDHEDLKGNIHVINSRDESKGCNHGTASTGCIAAKHNEFGVSGIASGSNFYFYDTGDIDLILRDAEPGDIVSLDSQFSVNGNLLPMIYSKYWWDCINALVNHNVVVIMAAGNGGL
ncbi:MAG: hypothetical protein C0508_31160, partial [Cyanobacteria bacterium PR.023]|nr:hypothetical protein [Cyanobacteria bacterium PR.023]